MGRIDTLTKEYMKRPSIFADVFNQFLYHGKQIIKPDRLVELDTAETAVPYGTDNVSVPEQRYRDAVKLLMSMTDGKAAYCILAAENESKINYAMPVKNGLYDFLQLAHQVTAASASHKKSKSKDDKPSRDEFLSGFWKNDRLLPVVTVVVHFGAEKWDGPLSLRDMYTDCGDEILKHAADYRISLITPDRLSDKEIDEFQTSMREIMRYIKYSNDKKKLDEVLQSEKRFKQVERSAVEIINAVTNSNMKMEEGKELIDVCLAIQEMKEESRMEGEIQGELRGEIKGELKGAITFAKALGISRDEAKKSFMLKYNKSAEETEELMKVYWK